MKKSFSVLLMVFASQICQAQYCTLKGVIEDSALKRKMSFATVAIYSSKDSSLLSYQLSNENGEFLFKKLQAKSQVKLVVSYSGYQTLKKHITLTSEIMDLGKLWITIQKTTLGEIIVNAERPPIIFKNGMIEFNTFAFKTFPNSVVEDLLKKLPGVQIESNGTILVNGKKVNRITVDGKSFFGDDTKIASRNLPASIIESVQVMADKEEIDRDPELGIANAGSIINLTLKKGAKNKWFGKMYGGQGNQNKYEMGGLLNLFKDTIQITLLGFKNNVNKNGFSIKDLEDLGGFNKNWYSNLLNEGSSSNEVNNLFSSLLQYFNEEIGVSKSVGSGFNINRTPNKFKSIYFQYFYGKRVLTLNDVLSSNQFIGDTVINILFSSTKNGVGKSHNIVFGWSNTDKNDLTIRLKINYSFIKGDDSMLSYSKTIKTRLGELNNNDGYYKNNINYNSFSQSFTLSKKFLSKDKRKLAISQNFALKNGLQEYTSELQSRYLFPTQQNVDYNQLKISHLPDFLTSLLISFSEPIRNSLSINATSRLDYFHQKQDIETYNKSPIGIYSDINFNLSNILDRKHTKTTNNLSFSFLLKKATFTTGASIQSDYLKINYSKNNFTKQHYLNFFPTVKITWKQNSISFDGSIIVPNAAYLNPITDSSNLFDIKEGNINLQPVKQYKFQSFFSYINIKKWIYYNITSNASFLKSAIILDRNISLQGFPITKPINVNGNYSINTNLSIGKDFKHKVKKTYSLKFNQSIGYSNRKIRFNSIDAVQQQLSFGIMLNFIINYYNKFELQNSYQLIANNVNYSTSAFQNTKTLEQRISTNLHYSLNKKISIESTSLLRLFEKSSITGNSFSSFLFNTSFSYFFLKNKFIAKFTVFDLFNQNRGISQFNSQNYLTELQTNVLKRFGLLSLIYNLRQ